MLAPQRLASRRALIGLGIVLSIGATACGGGGGSNAQVASLGTTGGAGAATATTTAQNTQDAVLAYTACLREQGLNVADPTFDANGNPSGGLFGAESGIDPRSTEFQAAQQACGNLLQGVNFGGGGRGGAIDRDAIQESLNNFTACLREQGLDVDDIDFAAGQPGAGGGPGNGGFGAPPDGSVPAGSIPTGGSVPPGGFGGGPGGGNGPGSAGFDPSARIIEQLGLDSTDPAVTKAVDACQSILTTAFTPTTTTTP